MWWRAIFNIHFSVLANFVMYVYLDVFFKLNIVSVNISHSFELLLCLIVLALTRHFKGPMKILAWMLYHKSHYPESHYQHIISNGIGISKISFFWYNFLLEKIYIQCTSIFFLLFSCSASVSLWYNFSTISYPSIQRCPLVF